jgi:hypothetical protein
MTILNPTGTINKKAAFCHALNYELPQPGESIKAVLTRIGAAVLAENPDTKGGALSNARGDWYEWLLAISAWNFHAANPTAYFALLLPNVSRFNVYDLYEKELAMMVKDLRSKMPADVRLITSNPDFVLIDATEVEMPEDVLIPITEIDGDVIEKIETMHRHFIGKCSYESIVGYLSVKTTFRPDRRLQISHEGSLMKALYTHIQTRRWILEPNGLKYYCCATEIGEADREGLRTVATHSITSVHTKPQAAVDAVFEINSLSAAADMWESILTPDNN